MFLRRIFGGAVRSTIAVNTSSQIVAKIFGAGATFLISLMVARTYGAQGYGDFTKVTTFVALFFLFSDFGLNAIYLKNDAVAHSGSHENADDAWSTLVSVRFLGSLFLVFLSLALLTILPRGTDQGYTRAVRLGILIFSPAIIFQSILTTANAMFQKHLRYDLSALAVILGSCMAVTVAFLTIPRAQGAVGPITGVLSILAGSAVTAGASMVLVRRLRAPFVLNWSFDRMLRFLKTAAPVGATLIFNVIYFRADTFILTLTRATQEVGIYGLAYKVFEVPLVLPTFFMNSVYPLLLASRRGPRNDVMHVSFRHLLSRSLWFLLLSALGTVVFLWFAAPLLTFVRSDFAFSIRPLRVLALGVPFFFLTSLTMWTLIALGKLRELAWVYGTSMVLNIVLNMLFIPTYGYIAAAWMTVVSEGLLLVVSILVLRSALVAYEHMRDARHGNAD